MVKSSSIDATLCGIRSGTTTVGIIGLGYVGLPLALAFSEKLTVLGYDADVTKRRMLKRGISYIDDVPDRTLKAVVGKRLRIADTWRQLKECGVIVICVPTPLDARGNPDLSYIQDSADVVQAIVRKGMLVVLESTSYPGTTEEYLGRAIRAAGFEVGRDVGLAFSPERVDPGNVKYNIKNTPKIVGGVDTQSTEIAASLYSLIVEAGVVKVRDCKTAEAAKIVENIFRGVNIALINELSLVFEKMGIDTWEVVRAASSKPFSFMPHYPGPGIGGHCIPLDPLYLSYKAKQYGFSPRFIELSHEVNEFMKHHTVNLTIDALKHLNLSPDQATVAVMGLAYKKNISDTRESPAVAIIEELHKKVRRVMVHDPKAKEISTSVGVFRSSPLGKILADADCVVFLLDHDKYVERFPAAFFGTNVRAVVDTRNLFMKDQMEAAGLVYVPLGK